MALALVTGAPTVAGDLVVAAAQQHPDVGNQRPMHVLAAAAANTASIDDQVLQLMTKHQQSNYSARPQHASYFTTSSQSDVINGAASAEDD